ncbi:TonB-dependent receptor [Alteromonadaceae bacterium M269]|nr:TonB-dependent receptor [Alteromonadaceae bacterium M269]
MYIKSKLAKSIALACAFGTVAATFSTQTLSQENQREEAEEQVEKITVTGSRLRRNTEDTVAVTEITAEKFELRQYTNAIEALQELPFVGLGTNNQGANTQFGDNTANPDLLNLQTNRTLTLVNGQRFVSSNQATVFVPGNANGSQVDLTLINPSLIERTEVVIGSGGSATYGADAVAGVVNVILKDDFEGVEVTTRYGVTEEEDGENKRINFLAGKNFLDGRANITLGLEYFDTNLIQSNNPNRLSGQQSTGIANPLDAGPGDGIRSTVFIPGTTNPLASAGGLLTGAPFLAGGTNAAFFPNTPNDAFTAAGLGTPFQFAQTAAGQALNPLLFVGTFSPAGTFLTVPNTDAATSAFLPRRAVPLGFDSNGQLVPFNVGNINPPNPADQNTAIGGDGLPVGIFNNVQSAQERFSVNLLTRYDINDNVTYKAEYYYSDIKSRSVGAPLTNVANGNTTAGSRSVPVFVDENPFLSSQAVELIDQLVAEGLEVPEIGGERALFLSRSLNDITGGAPNSGSETEFFRTSQNLEGEFEAFDRYFNWSVNGSYGRVQTDNFADQLLDIEFALATDVVEVNGRPVCRQQTLDAPESIAIRNPQLANINTTVGLVPSFAQVNACQPLNLFGEGAPSQAAIDYVSANSGSRNVSEQTYFSAQLGGDVVTLPGGDIVFSTQVEFREETNEFTPSNVFANGLARNTTGQGSNGEADFIEYGIELSVPIFGGDFTFPALQSLELDFAGRVVDREGRGGPFNDFSESRDEVFNIGLRWQPIDDLLIRASRSSAIRSPSIVELFGAGVTGFSGLGRGNLNPCDVDAIDNGSPNRRTNCETLVQNLGLPLSVLDNFQAPAGAPNAPAAGASNPGLRPEESDSWSVGFVYEPEFIKGLSLSLDYYELELTGEIGLTGLNFQCFDSPTFPTNIIGGFESCNALVFAVEDPNNPGQQIIPFNNPVTGDPIPPIANPGSPANDQLALTNSFSFFPTLNLGETEIRSYYLTANYQFDAGKYGRFRLNGSAYRLLEFSEITGGNNDPRDGEPGDEEWSTVFTVGHQIAGLTQSVQWFFTSSSVDDVETDPATFGDLTPTFFQPAFHIVNYSASYDLNDHLRLQFVVNNVFDNELDEATFRPGDVLGRRYSFGFTSRF